MGSNLPVTHSNIPCRPASPFGKDLQAHKQTYTHTHLVVCEVVQYASKQSIPFLLHGVTIHNS